MLRPRYVPYGNLVTLGNMIAVSRLSLHHRSDTICLSFDIPTDVTYHDAPPRRTRCSVSSVRGPSAHVISMLQRFRAYLRRLLDRGLLEQVGRGLRSLS